MWYVAYGAWCMAYMVYGVHIRAYLEDIAPEETIYKNLSKLPERFTVQPRTRGRVPLERGRPRAVAFWRPARGYETGWETGCRRGHETSMACGAPLERKMCWSTLRAWPCAFPPEKINIIIQGSKKSFLISIWDRSVRGTLKSGTSQW